MNKVNLFFLTLATTFFVSSVSAQNDYFDGSVTYLIRQYDANGSRMSMPVEKEKVFFTKHKIFNEVIAGPGIQFFGKNQYFMDIERGARYAVDHDRKTLRNIGIPDDPDEIETFYEVRESDQKILNYECDVHILKYEKKYQGSFGSEIDTLIITFYNSKKLKIFRPDLFAILQGNKNGTLLDGRYDGVPLKVVLERTDGSFIVIEATDVKKFNVSESLSLKSYILEN